MGRPEAIETKQALVAAAVEALAELGPAQLISAVGAKEIARRAGFAVTTLYHHFGTLEEFADAVVAAVFDPATIPADEVTEHLAEIRDASFPVTFALEAHQAEFTRLAADPNFRTRVGMWALGGSGVDEIYARFLRDVDGPFAEFLNSTFAAWGREMRPPIDIQTFVAFETALLCGAMVRHSADPDTLDAGDFARVALSLVVAALRPIGDEHTFEDRLSEINYYPLRNGPSMPGDDGVRDRVLASAEELFARRDGTRVTVVQLTRSAGIGTTTFYRVFDGLHDVEMQLLYRRVAQSLPDLDSGGDQQDRLVAVVSALATSAELLASYARSLAERSVAHADPIVDFILGSEVGADEPDLGARDAVELSLLIAVRELLRHPAQGASGVIEKIRSATR